MRDNSNPNKKNSKDSQDNSNSCEPVKGNGQQFIPPRHKYIQIQKFSSPFFTDHNQQQYVIKRAFNSNNFTYLRKLPDNIQRNFILDQRIDKVKQQICDQGIKRVKTPLEIQNSRNQRIKQLKKTKIGSLGYFQVFPYQQSDYQLPKKIATQQRIQNIQKRKQVNDKDFYPAGFDKKMKYQDPFFYIDKANPYSHPKYLYPFHLPQDTYDSYKQNQRRRRIIDQQLRIAGQFYPAKSDKTLTVVNKSQLPQIVTQIQFYFKKFLKGQYGYFIGVNKKDHIQILFQSKYLQDIKLQMIMSGICQHQILCKYCLRKYYPKFGKIQSTTNFIQFVILPPWIKDIQSIQNTSNNSEINLKDSH